MTNIEQFLLLAAKNNIIKSSSVENFLKIFDENFPNSDLIKDSLIYVSRYKPKSILDQVLTFSEAQILYDLSPSTLLKNIDYNRYLDGEVKKSGSTWLITTKAMERLYGSKSSSCINIEKFFNLCIKSNHITKEIKKELLSLIKKEYPNMDIYNINKLNIKDLYNDNNDYTEYEEDVSIDDIYTFAEATEKYNLYKTTLRKNVDYGRYIEGEVRQSKATWLITKKALDRLYGSKIK